jgi:CPA2 family monovalent cation:H+ antiporter-2
VGLRKRYGVTLLSIRRNSEMVSNPGADTIFLAGDISILVGTPGEDCTDTALI